MFEENKPNVDEFVENPLILKTETDFKQEVNSETNDLSEVQEHETKHKKVKLKIKKEYSSDFDSEDDIYTKGYIKFTPLKEKKINGVCRCSKECFNLFSDDEKQSIFEEFWQLKSSQQQTEYLKNCMQIKNLKKFEEIIQTVYYFIKVNKKKLKICRTAFLNLHGLDKYHLDKVIKYFIKPKRNEKIQKNSFIEATKFIRNSLEFKSCQRKCNFSNLYKAYAEEFKQNKITSYKFSKIFKEEIKYKLNKMCRICLIIFDETNLTDIFSMRDNALIGDLITELAQVQVLKSEKHMPSLICKFCLDKLCISIDFRRLCIQSDQILRLDPIKSNTDQLESEDFQYDFIDSNFKEFKNDSCDIRKEILKKRFIEENEKGEFKIRKHPEYDHQKNKLVNPIGQIQGPPCTCPRKCYSLISDEDKKRIFDNFWKIKTVNKQSSYLHDCLQSAHVKQRRLRKKPENNEVVNFKRSLTIYYRVPIENGKKWLKVCQTAFVNLHSLKSKRIRSIIKNKKLEISKMPPPPRTKKSLRGKKRKKDVTLDVLQIDEIKKEEKIETGNCNQKDEKQENLDNNDEYFSSEEDEIESYECQICYFKYNSASSLRKHKSLKNHYTREDIERKNRIRTYKPNQDGQYVCYDCGSIFLVKKSLRDHWSRVHNNHNYACELCGEIFNRYSHFHHHKSQHKRDSKNATREQQRKMRKQQQQPDAPIRRQFSCDICGKSGFSFNYLEKHRFTHFDGQQTFTCHFCSSIFLQPNLLNEHILLMHYPH